MPWTIEQIFWVKIYYKTKFFKIAQARYRQKFNFTTFPNRSLGLVKNCEAHGTFEDRRLTRSLPNNPPVIKKEYARVINNFAHRIQVCFQRNG